MKSQTVKKLRLLKFTDRVTRGQLFGYPGSGNRNYSANFTSRMSAVRWVFKLK